MTPARMSSSSTVSRKRSALPAASERSTSAASSSTVRTSPTFMPATVASSPRKAAPDQTTKPNGRSGLVASITRPSGRASS